MNRWSTDLAIIAERTGTRLETVVKRATFGLFATAVKRSPVDTGRFRANWNVSFDRVDPVTTEATTASRADSEVRKVLSAKLGDVTYLSNSLPYAVRLEFGWSKQAPYGMVRLAMVEHQLHVLRAVESLGAAA